MAKTQKTKARGVQQREESGGRRLLRLGVLLVVIWAVLRLATVAGYHGEIDYCGGDRDFIGHCPYDDDQTNYVFKVKP